jgi:hypothetical protein
MSGVGTLWLHNLHSSTSISLCHLGLHIHQGSGDYLRAGHVCRWAWGAKPRDAFSVPDGPGHFHITFCWCRYDYFFGYPSHSSEGIAAGGAIEQLAFHIWNESPESCPGFTASSVLCGAAISGLNMLLLGPVLSCWLKIKSFTVLSDYTVNLTRFAASWHLELDLRIFEGSLPVLLRYIDLCGRLYIVVASPGFVKSSFQSRFPTQNQSGTKHSSRPPSTSSDWVYSETLGLCLSSSYV